MRLVIAIFALLFSFIPNIAKAINFESGVVTLQNTFDQRSWTFIPFQDSFNTTPVVFLLPDNAGGNPGDIRVTQITTTGFYATIVEPLGMDGPHIAMGVSYMAAEPGTHELPDGTKIEIGTISTNAYQGFGVTGTSWDTINFSQSFTGAPALITQIQTINSEQNLTAVPGNYNPFPISNPWLTEGIQNVTSTSAQVALELSEVEELPTANETIGYFAMEQGSGTFTDDSGATITYDSFATGNVIDGWSNGCDTVNFPTVNSNQRTVLASKRARLNGDGGWLRTCNYNTTSVTLTMDEDTANDSERSHPAEPISIIVFSDNVTLSTDADIVVNKTADKSNADEGETVSYTITIQNNVPVNATNIILDEALPTGVTLQNATPSQGSFTP